MTGLIRPLQNLPNVLLTPHIGGSHREAQQNIGADVSNKLLPVTSKKGITIGSLIRFRAISLPPRKALTGYCIFIAMCPGCFVR